MESDSQKARESEEIKRRIDYLINTDEISAPDKIAIAMKALKIVEESKMEKEVQ